ncbi:MAG TPA: isoprenylcysteine carboxylmethyltransferase family protein [Anaerolineales bacterium]|nr:isoprenylcysteine carboxylmethyltransferase family protein [Anaerolineales bacterium]
MSQPFFHLTFILVFVAFMGIRAYYFRKAQKHGGKAEYKEEKMTKIRQTIGWIFPLTLLAYMLRPSILGWATLTLPGWVQWTGVVLGLASLALIWWVQWALDVNFAVILHVRDKHTLITHGPYKWVRHPMYTTLYIHALSTLFLTKNWLVGGLYLLSLTWIVIARLKNEEATMIEKFGDAYRNYMTRTGRFLPKLI